MPSNNMGKQEVIAWIKEHFPKGATCLDVGPCDGKWGALLGGYLTMDAVEIYEPYIEKYRLKSMYRNVWCMDVADLEYDWYDLIIFGDVIEHMTVEQAQKVISYAEPRCKDMIIAVPFLYKQGEWYGNKWQAHIQDDLTPELFDQRYPGFRTICRPQWSYAYYAKQEMKKNE